MTTQADFTPEEWETVREAPTSAGMIVSSAVECFQRRRKRPSRLNESLRAGLLRQ